MAKKTETESTGTEVAEVKKTELANLEMNPFEIYGSQVSQRAIVGRLLKFSKGDWLAGEDEEELPPGTKLVANMDQLMVGWIKWVDNRPDQQIMGLIIEGYQPPKRASLGDLDQNSWEVGNDGRPRDPWQFTNYVLMKEPGADGSDDENLFTFTTSSKGGLNCIGDLCKAFGKQMRMRPDEYPVVEIGTDSYNHPNKEFGRIKTPTLRVVGWEKKDLFGKRQEAA